MENTYLSTFQALGGLGLLLGTLGLAAVLLRNVMERRRELALLRAVGYRPAHLRTMVIVENAFLLIVGTGIGAVCALVAIAPAFFERGGHLPNPSLALLLLAVPVAGMAASLAAVRAAMRSVAGNFANGVGGDMRLIIFLILISNLIAENWPQWRGPNLNNVSGETNLPLKWGPRDNIAWKLPLPGWSGSTPIIWGDHIFLSVAERGSLYLWCVDRQEPKVEWKRLLAVATIRDEAEHVHTVSGHGWQVGLGHDGDRNSQRVRLHGKELWGGHIQKDYGRFGLNWGYHPARCSMRTHCTYRCSTA